MGKYTDVSHDGMRASCSYGDADAGKLLWGNNVLNLAGRSGIYLSFAFVDRPNTLFYGKHIAYMASAHEQNVGIFCVCEDNSVSILPNSAYGTNPGLVTPACELFYCISGTQFNNNGIITQIPITGGTSQGMAYVTDGKITWMDQVIGNNSPTYGNARFTRPYKIGNWVFGQAADGPDKVLAYNILTGINYVVWNSKTEVAPRGNFFGNEVVCAISEPGLFVEGKDFIPSVVINDPFKQAIIDKLPFQLTPDEISYLQSLVRQDM